MSQLGRFDEPYHRVPSREFASYEESSHPKVFFGDDFLGSTIDMGSHLIWSIVEVGTNVDIATNEVDYGGGICRMIFDADNVAQDNVLYWGDDKNADVSKNLLFECRMRTTALPGTGVRGVVGMAGDHNLAKDSVTEAAWFSWDASGAVKVETDDTTNNTDATTSITTTATAWHVYQIDFRNIADVKFFIDGAREGAGTTFDMSNLSAAESLMQPYISLDKASGTGLGTFDIDYVKIWFDRTD